MGPRIRLAVVHCVLLLLVAGSASAQYLRPEGTLFIKPKVGISSYLGDNEKSPSNFNGDGFSVAFPWGLGAEVGYQISVPFSVSGALYVGDYPVITQFPPPPVREDADLAEDPTVRTSIQAFGRYTFASPEQRVAPYLNFGLTYSFGTATQNDPPGFATEESASAFGPLFGLGLDFALNNQSSFFVELNSGIHLGDDQLDANSANGFGGTDVLSGLGLGFKYNFSEAVTPPMNLMFECPAESVIAGQATTFSATLNPGVSEPVTTQWEFGDGNSATGATATHTYAAGGVYTATFTALNSAGAASVDCVVTVQSPAELVTVTADKMSVSICDEDQSIAFSANARGDTPISYSWDFGDGSSSDAEAPSHTFGETGTYEVTLTVRNAGGEDSRTIEITVTEQGCFDCDISQMNSVFFDRNSSVLTPDGREQLAENLEVLTNCTFGARIEGHASRDERNAQGLSEDRARAVMQFYVDNGIDASRLSSTGMGASGQTTKKSGASQFRRVDTIPEHSDM